MKQKFLITLLLLPLAAMANEVDPGYYKSKALTKDHLFTFGIEGITAAPSGEVYAMNFASQGTIGKLTDGHVTAVTTLDRNGVASGSHMYRDGTLLMTDYKRHRLLKLDLSLGTLKTWVENGAMSQPNDLTVSREGRVYASDPFWKKSSGRVWVIEPDTSMRVVADHLGTTNGIELSPDEKTLYVSESRQKKIWSYTVRTDGSLDGKHLFFTYKEFDVDGIRADQTGRLFLTLNGGGSVLIVTAQGSLERTVPLLGKNPTNLTFGGADGKTVYVTMRDKGGIESFQTDVAGRNWQLYKDWGLLPTKKP